MFNPQELKDATVVSAKELSTTEGVAILFDNGVLLIVTEDGYSFVNGNKIEVAEHLFDVL